MAKPKPIRAYVVAVDTTGAEISQRIPGMIHASYDAMTFRPDVQTPARITLDVAAGVVVADVEGRREGDGVALFHLGQRAVWGGDVLTVPEAADG